MNKLKAFFAEVIGDGQMFEDSKRSHSQSLEGKTGRQRSPMTTVAATEEFDSAEHKTFAKALARAVSAAPPTDRDYEEVKTVLMTGILDAARRGVRDEDILTDSALSALILYDNDERNSGSARITS